MVLAAKPGRGFAKRTAHLDTRGTRRGVAASSCPAKKGRITRAGVHRSDSPALHSSAPLARDHRANRPGCQDLSPTKKERGASCRPPCLLLSWHFIKGPESASLNEWFASCGLLDLRAKVRSLMLARLAGPVCCRWAGASLRGYSVKCVSLIRFYELDISQVQHAVFDRPIQVCG
jgi:hypothetical protein